MSTTNGIVNLQTGIYLNVRQEPNFYANILGTLAPNTEVTIIEQNGNWFKISYNDQNAYVFSKAIKASETITQGGIFLNLNVPNNFEFGNTGEQPTFNWNALVTTSSIPIKNESGEVQNGYCTSNGDHITIIKNNPETNLTFIQYPDQGANMYQQGWIDSSFISNEYLDFRFISSWTNETSNQNVYLFNETISQTTLSAETTYTLLYTIKNYGDTYACILFNENNATQLGFVPFSSGSLNFILGNYPYDILNETSIGSYNPTVPTNAIVNTPVQLIDINGIKPNYYTNSQGTIVYPTLPANTEIAILQVFTSAEEQSMLIEYFSKSTNTYKKAYVPVSTLYNNSISITNNKVVWNNPNGTVNLMNLSNSSVIYNLPASQTIQYLYSTNEFACILFNNNNLQGYPLQTGYVNLNTGTFLRKSDFTANLRYIGAPNGIALCILGNIDSHINFSKATQINLVFKDTIFFEPGESAVNLTVPATSQNWFSENTNDYSTFEVTIDPYNLSQLNMDDTYDIFVSFTLDGTNYEIPLCNNLNTSLSGADEFYFTLHTLSNNQLTLSIPGAYWNYPLAMPPEPKAPTVNSPWTGIATGLTKAYPYSSSSPTFKKGEIIYNIIGEENGYYYIQTGKNAFYYPGDTIAIIQKFENA